MRNGLARLKNLNIPVNTFVDVGAAAGSWTLLAKGIWPDQNYLLFEPLNERQGELEKLATGYPNISIIPHAAGKTVGEIQFNITDDLDGSGIDTGNNDRSAHTRRIKQTTIDLEIIRLGLKPPYIIKLDTHGYEVPVIEGCTHIAGEISAFIIECYGFRIAPNSLQLWEMCRYMNNLGFRLFDMVDIMNREADGAFWQCDAFFIKKDHPVFNINSFI